MARVMALDHIVLNVADVERSLEFYQRWFGLQGERVEAWRSGEVRFPSVRIGDTTIIDLFQAPPEPAERRLNLAHFCLVTDAEDLEPVIGELRAAGVTVERGPVTNWGARGMGQSIYLRDPDDNLIELRTYAGSASGS